LNWDIIFNSTMSLTDHVNTICKSSLVSSHLDHCNSLITDINQSNMLKLKIVQNPLARAVTNMGEYEHITSVCKDF